MPARFLAEYVATIGMDVFREKIKDGMDRRRLKALVERYLDRKYEQNYVCTMEEEIDFEGLCDYARQEMIADIEKCIFSAGKEQKCLKNDILNRAVAYARPMTQRGERRVQEITSDIIDILRGFYRDFKTDDGMLLLTGEIELKLDDMLDTLELLIKGSGDDVASVIKREFADLRTHEKRERLRQIELMIDSKREAIANHSIFPWFRGSWRYSEVFPRLFIPPRFKVGSKTIGSRELSGYLDDHAVVLGEAGAGKSTFLRYLFIQKEIDIGKCVYMTANEAKREDGLFNKLSDHVSKDSEDTYLVLIDGIDEAFAYDYAGLSRFIERLQSIPNVHFWIGCRSDYYERHYNEFFSFIRIELTIEPWEMWQSDAFIDRYAEIVKRPDLKDAVDELIGTHSSIKQFKTNPFQLSLLVFLAEHGSRSPIIGLYDLYERFMFCWIEREKRRGTSNEDEKTIIRTLINSAIQIYCGKEYVLDDRAAEDSAIRDLLQIQEKGDLTYVRYASAFHHRSLAAFLIAHSLIESFLNNDTAQICYLFSCKLKDDVTNFIGDRFTTLDLQEKDKVKRTLVGLYKDTKGPEVPIKEQVIYYITRLGIDVSDFLLELVKQKPHDPIMRLTIAYGCVLSDHPLLRRFALDYARSIAEDTIDARTNRGWTVIYFGDVEDQDPYQYKDDEKGPWKKAREARIKRFVKKSPRLKDYRFRLFDIPLFYSFLKDRGWNDISRDEYKILSEVDLPQDIFMEEEISFLTNEKERLLFEYKRRLESDIEAT